jgi:hypothetical protein
MCRVITTSLQSTTRIIKDRTCWVIGSLTLTLRSINLLITIGERGRFRYDNIRSLPGRLLISLCLVGLAGCFGQFQGGL